MKTCPHCHARMVAIEDGRALCWACGWSRDTEPSTLEKYLSNLGADRETRPLGLLAPIEAPAAVTARVLAVIREEAARCGS